MTAEARALARALLDHRRRVSVAGQSRDSESCAISYGHLCERAGLPHLKPTVGKYLREIAEWCHDNGWPPLNALAVNHETRRPGRGYDGAPGCSRERWEDDVIACINFADYPDVIG